MDRPRVYAYGTPLVLLLVFVLSFLTCVSVPISQSISLFDLDIRQAGAKIRAGLWGYCTPDNSLNGLQCSKPRVGWTLKGTFSSETCPFSPSQAADARICTEALNDLGGLVSSSLTSALLIHIFATILAFLTFFLAAVFVLRPDLHQRVGNRLRFNNSNESFTRTISSLFLPLLFTLQLAVQLTIALIVDIIVVLVAKRNATKVNSGTSVTYGSVTWISLVTAMLAWAVLVIQIIESSRDQTKKSRSSMQRNNSLEPGSRLSRTLSVPLTPHTLQSRSVTTPSDSEYQDEPSDSAEQSFDSDSQSPKKSSFLFCCGARGKNLKPPDDSENLPPTPSTPPQHQRFSWEPRDDETDTGPSSNYDEGQNYDHSAQSPIYARLPCIKRSKPKPDPPEEIELQEITVAQDGSSSIYSQNTASVQEIPDGVLDTDATSITSRKDVHDSNRSHFTWDNIKKALQEMFVFKGKDNETSGDTSKGEESSDDNENPEAQYSDEHAIEQHDVSDPSDEALTETPEQLDQERVWECNEAMGDDVSLADDEDASEELLQSQTNREPEDQGLDSEGGNVSEGNSNDAIPEGEDDHRQTNTDEIDSDEDVKVAGQDISTPEDNVPDSTGDGSASENEDSDQARGTPEESGYNEEVLASDSAEEVSDEPDYKSNPESATPEETSIVQEKEAGTEADMEEEPEPAAENVDSEDRLAPRDSSKDADSNEEEEESDSEKLVITCREADDEIRPDKNMVKRHSNVEIMQNLPGKPLVCTACGAYIFVDKHDES